MELPSPLVIKEMKQTMRTTSSNVQCLIHGSIIYLKSSINSPAYLFQAHLRGRGLILERRA